MKKVPTEMRRMDAKRRRRAGFSEVEVIVSFVIALVAVGLLYPLMHPRVAVRGQQTMALSNAKQIALALRLYASDNNGVYPSFTLSGGKPTSTTVKDSNTAFAQLFPTYLTTEAIFWLKDSRFCSVKPPDEVIDNPPLDVPVNTLRRGENEWAYVLHLTDSSNPSVPLIASGFSDPVLHMYSTNPLARGGRWKGVSTVVIRADNSGAIIKLNPKTLQAPGSNGTGGMYDDIFNTARASSGWLKPENAVVNPK